MLEAVAQALFETVCGATGHGLLWVLTLGRWKAFQGGDTAATAVGLLFWVMVGAVIAFLLIR